MDSTIYSRVKALCDEKGISISKLEAEVGASSGAIGKWRTNGNPSIDKISKIATYFHVSIDYLVGLTDTRSPADDLLNDHKFISIQRSREKLSTKRREHMDDLLMRAFDFSFEEDEV